MKNLIAKLKSMDYKAFFLTHGEKLGMGVVGLIALTCLAMTRWGGYEKTPEQMEEQAKKVQATLQANRWPQDEMAKFAVVSSESVINRYLSPLDLAAYDYQIPLSPKLNIYRKPADEPEVLPPLELIARPIEFTVVEVSDELAMNDSDASGSGGGKSGEKASDKKASDKKSSDKKSDKKKGGDLDEIAASAESDGSFFGGSASNLRSRGYRAVVVTGVIPRRAQLERLKKALHLSTLSQADAALVYNNFRIERQRAVPGPNPWPEKWQTVSLQTALDLLDTVELEEADLVPAEYTEAVFTMTLPRRIDDEWDDRVVVHPRIPTLTAQERAEEEARNAAAAELLEGEDEDGGRKRGGLARGQRDAKRMRQSATNRAGGDEGFSGAMQGFLGGSQRPRSGMAGAGGAMGAMAGMGGGAMGGMGGGMSSRPPAAMGGGAGQQSQRPNMSQLMSGPGGARGGAGAGAGAMAGMPMSGMPGGGRSMPMSGMAGMSGMSGMSGMAGMSGTGTAPHTGADLLLFRFFDFDVEPGECYRYRVIVEIENPSYNSDYVSQTSVKEGEFRESVPSEPSTLAIAPREIHYAVKRVPKVPMPQRAAELDVIQFDTDVGSLVEATLPLKYGQYVGGEKETEFPNLGKQTFKKEKVNFASQDLFLDAAAGPKLSSALQTDLALNPKQFAELQNTLDQAVTVNRFGDLIPLDGGSTDELAPERKRLNEQYDKFKDLKAADGDSDSANNLFSSLFGSGQEDEKGNKKKRGRNSLKGGSGRGMGGMSGMSGMSGMGGMGGGGMSMPMSGMSGMGGGKKGGKK